MQDSNLVKTDRRDKWWLGPLLTVIGLTIGFGYLTYAAFQGEFYKWGPYLSPAYSPLIILDWFPFSPAFLILWAPGGFRMTCYYYRKAYYRSGFLSPPACAVRGVGKNYKGETKLFLIQNIHRYFMYLAIIFIFILWYDVWHALWFTSANGGTEFGIGLGTIIMGINTIMLSAYTFGCHCYRHLIGGKLNFFSRTLSTKFRHKIWQKVSFLNKHHMFFAWCSLFTVGFTDLYIRMLSMGIWHDLRFF
jgi:hypothetical protein